MSEELVPVEVICASCGAEASANATYCWMCGEPLEPGSAARPSMRSKRRVGSTVVTGLTTYALASALLVVFAGLGMSGEVWGSVAFLAALVIAAALTTFGKTWLSKSQGKPLDRQEVIKTFLIGLGGTLMSMAVMAVVATLVAVALIVALVITCLSVLRMS